MRCVICGKEFIRNRPWQVTDCPECSRRHKVDLVRRWRRKHPEYARQYYRKLYSKI